VNLDDGPGQAVVVAMAAVTRPRLLVTAAAAAAAGAASTVASPGCVDASTSTTSVTDRT